ncbi:hypothetical protein A1L58_08485 [Shewanella baltica]|uniref:CapA family protein n=1 Tax=Shewanella baltica TaxID=62322 RepID=UPI0007B47820|nr:CapA family protein [Shewanella baltica]KZK65181.1 hypothetical protein A1L58_08485 [Shewanella baltica]
MSEVSISLIVGGDFCPVNINEVPLVNGDIQDVFHDILPILEESDFNVCNLECPVVNKSENVEKFGPKLRASSEVLNHLGGNLFNCFGLSNNHIMDFGESGLKNTIKACEDNSIFYFGAGENIHKASSVKIVDIKGVKVGFFGIAEEEFSIAGKKTYGANPLNIIDNYKSIKLAKENCDFLILFFHSGNEQYEYPSPRLKKTCNFFADAGVDVIFCQHSHCVGSYENYMGKHIIYGQGNFLFDFHNTLPGWNEGLLVKLLINKQDGINLEFIPIFQEIGKVGVKLMSTKSAEDFIDRFHERSKILSNENAMEEKWNQYCDLQSARYLSDLVFPYNRYGAWLFRKFNITKRIINGRSKNLLINLFRCEIHRDVVLNILRRKR